jgi:hypothetical protein
MRRSLLLVLLLLCGLAAPAAAWEVRRDATPADFAAFHDTFSGAAYLYPRHRAAPLGLVGFEVYVDATYDDAFDEEPFFAGAVDGTLPGGVLSVARVGVRKGLPGGIDLGVAYGEALGGDLRLLSGEVQVALLEGGVVSPALGLRLTGTQTESGKSYDLDQYGAEVLVSKTLAVLTPFAGAGVVYSRGRLDGTSGRLSESDTQPVFYAGLTLNLLLPKITAEVEHADRTQVAVRVGFGF